VFDSSAIFISFTFYIVFLIVFIFSFTFSTRPNDCLVFCTGSCAFITLNKKDYLLTYFHVGGVHSTFILQNAFALQSVEMQNHTHNSSV
jgi:hypothetical protein